MPVKIRGLKKTDKNLKKMLPDARTKWAREMKSTIVDIITEKITSGISPVKGQNRYKKYSSKYSKEKGRSAPVDLVNSGDMLNNMKARQTRTGDIIIEFPDKEQNKKAVYHNYGRGNNPQRKILPKSRETFKADILNKILQALRKAVRESIK